MAPQDSSQRPALLGGAWRILQGVIVFVFLAFALVLVRAPDDPARLFRQLLLGAGIAFVLTVSLEQPRRLALRAGRPWRVVRPVLTGLIVCFALAECSLRLAAGVVSSPLLAPPNGSPAEISFTGELPAQRRPNTRLVVALGGSFGVGAVPREDDYLTLLDDLLDEKGETEVHDFSVAAARPADLFHLYRSAAAVYEPDLVLLALFVGEDIEWRAPPSMLRGDTLLSLAVLRRLAGRRAAPPLSAASKPTRSKRAFMKLEISRLQLARKSDDAWRAYAYTFDLLTRMGKEIGDRLRVVIVPDAYQVNDQLYDQLLASAGDSDAYDRSLPNRLLAGHLESQRIAHLDLLPALRQAGRKAAVYAPRDTRWNRLGNRVAARAIARWLESER